MISSSLKKIAGALISGGVLVAALGGGMTGCSPAPHRPPAPRMQVDPDFLQSPHAVKKADQVEPVARANASAIEKIDPLKVTRPATYRPYQGNQLDLSAYGEALYKDVRLSTNGLSCSHCHEGGNRFAPGFARPYPHFVAMAKESAGLDRIHLDEMIQLCMMVSMAAEPLIWNSRKLAALTLYAKAIQQNFRVNASAIKRSSP